MDESLKNENENAAMVQEYNSIFVLTYTILFVLCWFLVRPFLSYEGGFEHWLTSFLLVSFGFVLLTRKQMGRDCSPLDSAIRSEQNGLAMMWSILLASGFVATWFIVRAVMVQLFEIETASDISFWAFVVVGLLFSSNPIIRMVKEARDKV